MRPARSLAVLALALLLAACGWQLRGAGGGGFADVSVAVEGAVGNRILDQVAARLRDLGADVVPSASDARLVIKVAEADSRRRTVATDADGFASEYELRYRMRFSVSPGGEAGPETVGLPSQTVQTSASYPASPQDLQGQDAEEAFLRRDLRDDAIQLLLARVGRQR